MLPSSEICVILGDTHLRAQHAFAFHDPLFARFTRALCAQLYRFTSVVLKENYLTLRVWPEQGLRRVILIWKALPSEGI